MTIFLTILGAALLAYPVFAAIGLGLAICVFLGLLCLMIAIGMWFDDMATNQRNILLRIEDNYFMLERLLRK